MPGGGGASTLMDPPRAAALLVLAPHMHMRVPVPAVVAVTLRVMCVEMMIVVAGVRMPIHGSDRTAGQDTAEHHAGC
ncbi:hypothetical protein BK022_10045 [Methylorubrum extorquens]|uniref:Uncharacterized protein n=1 Tax=Methylorubrum extorquens TaxID=408 RepID=A0A1S1P1C3_METEX|nr:hypothetical protein BK022_10045 [Methylorubrum extorquens]